MDILNLLLNSGLNQNTLETMAKNTGLSQNSVSDIISKVAPALMQGANANFKSDEDSSPLLDLIKSSDLQNANIDDTERGNELLSYLTGSKDNSRQLASNVGSQLGIDASTIKSLLPMIAPLVAGLFNKQVSAANLNQNSNDLTSMLTNFIDQNNDGSIVDDLFRMAGGFFRRS
ncbi:MAG: DUF937 domain-containing protein [Campylobacter sp.]|nr:DUF937 domain-containing protein [Campylobacter sp.]